MIRKMMAIALLTLLALNPAAFAGAWGTGPFDNDEALDWAWELIESKGTTAIEAALNGVTGSVDHIDATACSRAVAAAEIIGSLRGKSRPDLPEEIEDWILSNNMEITDEVLERARNAITVIRDSNKSELAELWKESGQSAEEWHTVMSDLIERLQ